MKRGSATTASLIPPGGNSRSNGMLLLNWGFPDCPPAIRLAYGIPAVALAKYSGFGDDSDGPYANDNNSLQFVDSISNVRGLHSFKLGGEFRRDHYNQVGNQFARRFVYLRWKRYQESVLAQAGGDDFADFILGQVKRSEVAVAIASAQFLQNSFALYIDDTLEI